MGWSWALWLSQEIVSFQCLKACGYSDDSLVRDKNPPPPVMPGQPPLGIYVDNVHAFAGKSGDASSKIEAVKLHFERLGIPFEVDAVDGQQQVESLGLCFSFTDRVRVRAKKDSLEAVGGNQGTSEAEAHQWRNFETLAGTCEFPFSFGQALTVSFVCMLQVCGNTPWSPLSHLEFGSS
jgi:hypothetical protein